MINYFVVISCLQCSRFVYQEDEVELRSERKKTWDDEYVLKRQFSALIPAFDPRPGRTNVNQIEDIVIPPPGMYARIRA